MQNESDVVMTEKGLADSKASFESAEPNCTQLAQEHEATVAGRAEELKVIEEAKKVLMGTTSETNVTKADRGAEIDRSDVSSVTSTERRGFCSLCRSQQILPCTPSRSLNITTPQW